MHHLARRLDRRFSLHALLEIARNTDTPIKESIFLCTNDFDDTVVDLCVHYAMDGQQVKKIYDVVGDHLFQQAIRQKHSLFAKVFSRQDVSSVTILFKLLHGLRRCMADNELTTLVVNDLRTLVSSGMWCHFLVLNDIWGYTDSFPDMFCHCFDIATELDDFHFLTRLMDFNTDFVGSLSRQCRLDLLFSSRSFTSTRLGDALAMPSATTSLKLKIVDKFIQAHSAEADDLIRTAVHNFIYRKQDIPALVTLLSWYQYRKEIQRVLSPDRSDGQIWSILIHVFPKLRPSANSTLTDISPSTETTVTPASLHAQLLIALHRQQINLLHHDIWKNLDSEEQTFVCETLHDSCGHNDVQMAPTKRPSPSWRDESWL